MGPGWEPGPGCSTWAQGPGRSRLDLLGAWGDLETLAFDAIVSAFVLHEFGADAKLGLVQRLAALLRPNGRLVVGDISFETAEARDAAHKAWRAV